MQDRGYKCKKWSSHHWSFMVREDGCIFQDWHMDDKDCHFCILPIYPCGNVKDKDTEDEDTDEKVINPSEEGIHWEDYYTVQVIPGTHKIPFKPLGMKVPVEDYAGKVLCLKLQVGQMLVACANLVHRGGPSANVIDMFGTQPNLNGNEKEEFIGAFKNLAIHGYLRHDNKKTMAMNEKIGEVTFPPTFV